MAPLAAERLARSSSPAIRAREPRRPAARTPRTRAAAAQGERVVAAPDARDPDRAETGAKP